MRTLKFAIVLVTLTFFSHPVYSQWFQQSSGVTLQLYSVFFVNANTGFIASDSGKVLRTTNGGTNWISSTPIGDTVSFRSVYFVDANTGFIAGRYLIFSPLVAKPIIIKTTNGGLSWSSAINDSGYTLWSVSFINANTGFATGGLYDAGPDTLVETTNGGASWHTSTLGNGYLIYVTFRDANTGFVIAHTGIMYKTTNTGANWNLNNNFSIQFVQSAAFIDNNTGFAVGGNSIGSDSSSEIFRTTDGGSSWNSVYVDHRGVINDIKFVNSNTGFATGTFETSVPNDSLPGRILKSTNSGLSWYVDTVFANLSRFISLSFADQNTGYAVGGNGVILKTTTGGNPIGIQQISSEVPKTFSLSQNYPNPFNPSTKIKFALPKAAFTKISIYDVLGREASVIVNEQLNAGSYEINWNAENLPSGVYFYKIESGDFTDSKKMILVK